MARDSNVVIIGAPASDVGEFSDSGSAFVYTRTEGVWTRVAELVAENAATLDRFGSSVAIQGNTILVGAPLDDDNVLSSGAVYVFTSSGSNWTQQAKLLASDAQGGDSLGQRSLI